MHDVLARVSLARLCHTLSRARSLGGMCNNISVSTIFFLGIIFSWAYHHMIYLYILFVSERPDIKSQFTSILYQLLLDPSDRVCFEAIMCVLGKSDATERY